MVNKSTFKSLAFAGAAVCMMGFAAQAEETTVTLLAKDAEIVETLNDNLYTIDGYSVNALGTAKINGYTFEFSTTRAVGATVAVGLIPAETPYFRLKGTNNALSPNNIIIKVTAPDGIKMTKVSFLASNTPNYSFCSTDDSPNVAVSDGKTKFYWEAPEDSEGLNALELKLKLDGPNVTATYNLSTIEVTYNDISDGVETVAEDSASEIYTLTGLRVDAPASALPAGLYIINGKKSLVR